MKSSIPDGLNLISIRQGTEKEIRAKVSEPVILQMHDAVYNPVKSATMHVANAKEDSLRVHCKFKDFVSPRRLNQSHIDEIRSMVDSDAKERDLQNALVNSGLLNLNCKALQEVVMTPVSDSVTDATSQRGMRMDLLLHYEADQSTQIVETKARLALTLGASRETDTATCGCVKRRRRTSCKLREYAWFR